MKQYNDRKFNEELKKMEALGNTFEVEVFST